MPGWIVVAVADGPMNMLVLGDKDGRPFTDQDSAEQCATAYRQIGGSYSVYVAPVKASR